MSTGYGYELPDGGLWPAEVLVKEHFEKRGWRMVKKNTLDFAAYRGVERCFVEVKAFGDKLNDHQIAAIGKAKRRGVDTLVALVLCKGYHYAELINGKPLLSRRTGKAIIRTCINRCCDEAGVYVVRYEDLQTEAEEAKTINPRLANALRIVLHIPCVEFWGFRPKAYQWIPREDRIVAV